MKKFLFALLFSLIAFPAWAQLNVASITLDNDQIKALPTTPVEIVAAQSGKVIVPVIATLRAQFSPYFGDEYANVTDIILAWPTISAMASFDYETGMFTGSVGVGDDFNYFRLLDGVSTPMNPGTPHLANQPLNVKGGSPNGQNFTGGANGNTLTVTVYFLVVDL